MDSTSQLTAQLLRKFMRHVALKSNRTNDSSSIAGQNIANPVAMILCVAMMFRYSLNMETEAKQVETAVQKVLDSGIRTPDLRGKVGTKEVGDAIVAAL